MNGSVVAVLTAVVTSALIWAGVQMYLKWRREQNQADEWTELARKRQERRDSVLISNETGLPGLPKGYCWEVIDWDARNSLEVRLVDLSSKTVAVSERPRDESGYSLLVSETTKASILEAAITAFIRFDDERAARRLIGTYPPKRIDL
jgi:hypothetical protein